MHFNRLNIETLNNTKNIQFINISNECEIRKEIVYK